MRLTRNLKETITNRVKLEPEFVLALLNEAATLFLNGEPNTAKLILRDLVNATIGFETLALKISTPNKSVHRMLSMQGNPTMNNLSAVFGTISHALKVAINVETVQHI